MDTMTTESKRSRQGRSPELKVQVLADGDASAITLTQAQFDALAVGLPWQRLPQTQVIVHM